MRVRDVEFRIPEFLCGRGWGRRGLRSQATFPLVVGVGDELGKGFRSLNGGLLQWCLLGRKTTRVEVFEERVA